MTALSIEQFEEIRFPVTDVDESRLRHLRGQIHRVAHAFNPAEGFLFLDGDGPTGPVIVRRFQLGRHTLGAQHAQRQPIGGHGKGGVQMQSPALSVGLIGSDHAQTLTLRQTRIIQIAAVLNTQHRALGLHAPHRPFPVRLQNVRHVNRLFIRMVDEPIERFHRRPISLRHPGKGTARFFCLRSRNLHESFAQPRVTQWRSAEFLFRPIVPIQTIGWTQRPQTAARRQAQTRSEVLLQRIHINVLDRFLPLAETILSAPPFRLSHQNPVGGPIAGAEKPGPVEETFHQPRTVMIAPLEILHHTLQTHAQQPRGQIAALDTGPDQKTAQAYDSVQVRASLFAIPTNPAIPIGQLPTQPAVCGSDQITDLPPDQRPGSLPMFPDHQFVPDSHLALLLDQDQLQSADIPHFCRHPLWFRHRLGQPSRNRTTLLNFWSGELKPAFGFQFPQALQATSELVLPTRVLKPKLLANNIC